MFLYTIYIYIYIYVYIRWENVVFQNPRKRKESNPIPNSNDEEDNRRSVTGKVVEHILTLQNDSVGQELPTSQHPQGINGVAVDVEVHYNDNGINNNTDRTIALDMAKITAGAPGIQI